MLTLLAAPAARARGALEQVGEMTLMTARAAWEVRRRPFEASGLLRQLDLLGVRSLPIVTLTLLFTGMVLALQTANALERYGAKHLIGQVVALSLVREMGPVLTALMVGGRVGAGITAELGSMAVTEQVDAMRALGASPLKKLVLPRLLAVLIMLPLLTVVGDAVGMLGGAIVVVFEVGQPFSSYWAGCFSDMEVGDFLSGVGKSVFFAAFITILACHNGLTARGGADGVGRATTRTVVAASITVLVSDFFLTKLFMLLP